LAHSGAVHLTRTNRTVKAAVALASAALGVCSPSAIAQAAKDGQGFISAPTGSELSDIAQYAEATSLSRPRTPAALERLLKRRDFCGGRINISRSENGSGALAFDDVCAIVVFTCVANCEGKPLDFEFPVFSLKPAAVSGVSVSASYAISMAKEAYTTCGNLGACSFTFAELTSSKKPTERYNSKGKSVASYEMSGGYEFAGIFGKRQQTDGYEIPRKYFDPKMWQMNSRTAAP
jgi:hypothetical protein